MNHAFLQCSWRFMAACLLLVLGLATMGIASGRHSSVQPAGRTVDERLATLTPDRPAEYLLLAEEIADEASTPEALALVRTLYVLAFDLGLRKGGESTAIAPSACLGLAALERLDADRRWLQALAGLLDSRYAVRDWNVAASASPADEIAYRAASALGLARAGEGRLADEWRRKPGVQELLRQYERAIGDTGQTGALSRFEKYIRDWPCPECGNKRVVVKQVNDQIETRLCFTCRGNPGPTLSNEEYLAQLGFESALLHGIQRSWAAQLASEQSAPLRDPNPEELAPTYRVDPTKPYWRQGRWTNKPD